LLEDERLWHGDLVSSRPLKESISMSALHFWVILGIGLTLGILLSRKVPGRGWHFAPWTRTGRIIGWIAIGGWTAVLGILLITPGATAGSMTCQANECSETFETPQQGHGLIGMRVNTPNTTAWRRQLPTLAALWKAQLPQYGWNQDLGDGTWTAVPLLTVNFFTQGPVRIMEVVATASTSWSALAQRNPGYGTTDTWMQLLTQPVLIATIHVEKALPSVWQHGDFANSVNFDAPYGTVRAEWFDSRASNGVVMAAASIGSTHTIWQAPTTVPAPLKMSPWTFVQEEAIGDGPCAISDALLGRMLCQPTRF